jgi:Zn-dependent M16 (insulinase) family peptidase
MAKMVADVMSKKTICVFGNEKKLEDNKKLFHKLVKVKQ